jgi:hypothetical protein
LFFENFHSPNYQFVYIAAAHANRNDLKVKILEFFHFAISFLKMNENPITINSN